MRPKTGSHWLRRRRALYTVCKATRRARTSDCRAWLQPRSHHQHRAHLGSGITIREKHGRRGQPGSEPNCSTRTSLGLVCAVGYADLLVRQRKRLNAYALYLTVPSWRAVCLPSGTSRDRSAAMRIRMNRRHCRARLIEDLPCVASAPTSAISSSATNQIIDRRHRPEEMSGKD